jgi:hypothetical protein
MQISPHPVPRTIPRTSPTQNVPPATVGRYHLCDDLEDGHPKPWESISTPNSDAESLELSHPQKS